MLSILPPETVEQLLAEIPCLVCDRKLGTHTDKERETCHDYAIAAVTLLQQAEGHKAHRSDGEEQGRHQT
jgi:hypothetical protein